MPRDAHDRSGHERGNKNKITDPSTAPQMPNYTDIKIKKHGEEPSGSMALLYT